MASDTMGIFRRKVPHYYIPIHPDNIAIDDWIILLEAGTIVGPKKESSASQKPRRKKRSKENISFLAKETLSRLGRI